MRIIWAALIGLAVSSAALPATAQTRLFSDNSELQLVIEAPLNTLVRESRRSTDPHAGTVTLAGGGEPRTWAIQLSARGFSRRTRDLCSFPPLRMAFDGGGRQGTIFQAQNKLKIVVRCRPGANYEQLVVLEYLAYRLYNEVTPLSYRVRPVRVTYRDSEGRRRDETQFNFLIEDVDDLARRNRRAALEVQSGEVPSTALDPQAATRYAMFQFMIGNLDWDMVQGPAGDECCHNSKLLGASATARTALIPAPYDFDFAGFVGAPYAAPPDGIPIRDVRQRYYRGLCRHNDQVPAALQHFRSRRNELNAVIAGETRLTDARRRTAQTYIDAFFDLIDDPERVERLIIERCRR